jgi:SAM-dependent methyltransferase
MIKSLAKQLLKKAGYQVTRVPTQDTRQSLERPATIDDEQDEFARKIAKDPLNPKLHLQYAFDASARGRSFLAYAELKTAECLGADPEQVEKHVTAFRSVLPDLKSMNHNQFFRFRTLASELFARRKNTALSILDVGGGQGQLATFLHNDCTYCLVEPTVNGISGTNLPFPDHSFDYVVACHVLEHIPVDERWLFLDQLLSKSKQGVILLNPCHVEGTHAEKRHKLVIEITGAQWAKDHLDCTLPKIDDIKDYATGRGLQFCIKPNGTKTTTLAFVFVDYFAAKSGLHEDWEKVNAFYNQQYTDILDSPAYPTAYLMYLGWPEGRNNATEQSAPAKG